MHHLSPRPQLVIASHPTLGGWNHVCTTVGWKLLRKRLSQCWFLRQDHGFQESISGSILMALKWTRLLGIIFDDSLSWSYYIDSVCCKVGRKIGALRRSFRLLTPRARRTYFMSVIQPDLEYATLTFTPSMNASLKNRLLAVWRRTIRCAAGVGYQDEGAPLLSEFRLTNIVDRWLVQFACYVRRCVKQEALSTSCAELQQPAHRHRTRGQENSFRLFLANNRAGLVSF